MRSEYRLPVASLLAVAAVFGTANLVGRHHAASILDNILLDDGARPDVRIFLPFEPERFHLEMFQEVGRYLGWHDDHAVILQSDPEELQRLARNYWVSDVQPYSE